MLQLLFCKYTIKTSITKVSHRKFPKLVYTIFSLLFLKPSKKLLTKTMVRSYKRDPVGIDYVFPLPCHGPIIKRKRVAKIKSKLSSFVTLYLL